MTSEVSFNCFKNFQGVRLFIHKIKLFVIMNRRNPQTFLICIETHLCLNKRQRRTCKGRWVRRRWRCCRDEVGCSGRRCAEGRAGWTSWTGTPPTRAPRACRSRFGHSSGSICTDSAFGKGISGMRTKLNVLLQHRVTETYYCWILDRLESIF